ncbi:hypothetical protein [Vibrio owensii]|uniref:hypothetical protein n=1 Tax=Vibrio owensii TaxID=696485 RepID=UPI0018F1926B|nr:hypothetical protein [Vibrio owensii]
MEEFFIGALRVLGALVRWIIIDFLLERVSYYLGYLGVSILTLGKRPHKPVSDAMRFRISYFGILLLVVIFAFMIWLS